MALELKQSLKLSQQLLITPQLQQAIKLLQLSRVELIETVQKELLENPVLEENAATGSSEDLGKQATTDRLAHLSTTEQPTNNQETNSPRENGEFDWENYIQSYNPTYGGLSRSFIDKSDELPNYENMVTRPATLQDHLEWQVHMSNLTPSDEECCVALIGNIDEKGYLPFSLDELVERTNFNMDQLEDALCLIQELDPPGVGARNLEECLLLQIKNAESSQRKLLTEIIKNHLKLLEKRDYNSIARKIGVSTRKAIDLCQIIFSLEPKPGRPFSSQHVQYVTPDVYVSKVGDDYVITLNEDGLPKLQISHFYKNAIMSGITKGKASTEGGKDEAQNYIQEKLKNALWLIKSIHQRQKTLYKVTKSIVQFQREFLDKGVQCLKPLVLRDIADEIGVHESTVSRATSGKYVHTPQGIFELKYFFNTGLSNSSGGEDFANEAVKQLVKKYIELEDAKSPLSDQAIADMLKGQNINIARRTVAKYREMLGILPSSKRRRMF